MKLTEQQQQIIRSFFAEQPVLRAYVFGSYARGDADASSDIDLLIDWDYSQPIGWGYVRAWRELKEKLNKQVDFVSVKWIDPSIEQKINREKQLVYEKTR
ncbi:MAG: nucleotidyltransferase domain-containing protein [Chitinophagales bacterium]|nr:nucleotidyltransferase domain-containing protein [Chitinophagales bacterium]